MRRISLRIRGISIPASLGIALLVIGAGCASVAEKLTQAYRVDPAIKQASFDHRCAQDRIHVVRHTENWLSVEMDVCGKLRRYQYVSEGPADSPGPIWIDTTDGLAPEKVPPNSR